MTRAFTIIPKIDIISDISSSEELLRCKVTQVRYTKYYLVCRMDRDEDLI